MRPRPCRVDLVRDEAGRLVEVCSTTVLCGAHKTQRSPFVVFLLGAITFGIYPLVWFVSTKEEMNKQGAEIPTAWLLVVPIANLIWTWKWCKGVEHVSRGETGAGLALVLLMFLGPIGMAIVQSGFNKRQLGAGVGPAQARLAA